MQFHDWQEERWPNYLMRRAEYEAQRLCSKLGDHLAPTEIIIAPGARFATIKATRRSDGLVGWSRVGRGR